MSLIRIARDLTRTLAPLEFALPVTHVYNPLVYARRPHELYLKRFGKAPREVFLLGMNPGPWGMAQTGVPFGEVAHVRDWMGIRSKVDRPEHEHPRRPVLGLACTRSEVSGARLWGWAADRFGNPENFFERFFVYNYCPLSFMEEGGKNRVPEKLPAAERQPLFAACDESLRRAVKYLRPRIVIGVGKFAEDRARLVLDGLDVEIGRILHPSPASPLANRGWAEAAEKDLARCGVELP